MTFLYIAISLKIIYILVAAIVNLHKGSLDSRLIPLRKLKKYIKTTNEIIAFTFIIYVFNPLNKKPVEIVHNEKVSLFLFALIGISNVNWNMVLNLVGVHIPFFE
jgi:hypothetical protein